MPHTNTPNLKDDHTHKELSLNPTIKNLASGQVISKYRNPGESARPNSPKLYCIKNKPKLYCIKNN